jgi:anthranilate phosphoribosyltransferase
VADFALAPTMAGALGKLGAERVLVVHGDSGVDEISLTGPTKVADLDDGAMREYTITPDDLGLPSADPKELMGGSAENNADITRSILAGAETGPKRDVVLANAAGALIAAGAAHDWRRAVEMAAAAIDDGSARRSLQRLIEVTNRPDPA